MISWILVSSVISACSGLIALRWRINLQRHKFDRSMQLIEFAQQWGTRQDVAEAATAADVVLSRLARAPLHHQVADRLLDGRQQRQLEPPKEGDGPAKSQAP